MTTSKSGLPSIQYAVRSAFKDCLRLRQKETLLVLADEPLEEMGSVFAREARHFSKHVRFLVIPEIPAPHTEPCPGTASLMSLANVVVMVTSKSLSHTQARRKACKNGSRIVSMPGINKDSLARTLNGNYREVVNLSRKISDILTIGKTASLSSRNGCSLTFSLARVKGHADTGMVHEPGQFSNLPAGEGSAGPAAGSANGVLVIDGSFPGIGKLKAPVRMTVRDGYVQRITGDEDAEKVRQLLRPYGKDGKYIAEIGIGTNPDAKFTGFTLEDEKVKGTVHVALGNNVSFDGKNDVPCHFDGILLKPTLIIDGIRIVSDGVLQF
ncbi:aminopeptidase [bacterium]|nr:aminopeptidase [bacterium]